MRQHVHTDDQRHSAPRARPTARSWALWSLPASALAVALAVDVAAAGGLGWALATLGFDPGTAARFLLLSLLAVAFAETVTRSDRIRRYLVGSGAFVDSATAWSIAAVVALPPAWAALCVAVLYAHLLLVTRREASSPPYRILFCGASLTLAALTASSLLHLVQSSLTAMPEGPRYAVALVSAVLAFQAVNYLLVYSVVYLATRPESWRSLLLHRDQLALEYAAFAVGVFTGVVVIVQPWLTPVALLILAMLYRGAMVTRLQAESRSDTKTGLLNFGAWREAAGQSLTRAARLNQPAALLLIDLDHFKQVNDVHGHLTGDRMLVAVAECLRSGLRGYDAVGRFGGEEFVALLDNTGERTALDAAERVRAGIAALLVAGSVRVTASVGVAWTPCSDGSLDALLGRADSALYRAKGAGRNQVSAAPAGLEATTGGAVVPSVQPR